MCYATNIYAGEAFINGRESMEHNHTINRNPSRGRLTGGWASKPINEINWAQPLHYKAEESMRSAPAELWADWARPGFG
jgi:hypothetical protein